MAKFPVSRSLHDVGLAAWFGGTLANAVALNAAAGAADDTAERGRVANTGWDRWTPVNAAAIGAHLLGAVGQLVADRKRIGLQPGVASLAGFKIALTAAALGVTAYSRTLGAKVSAAGDVPVASGAVPSVTTPPAEASALQQLRLLQWAVPALTGALVVISSYGGEQQRASEVLRSVPLA